MSLSDSQHPDANIGIATGAPTGFFALDVDPKNGGKDNRAMARFLEANSETTRWASDRVPRGQRVRLLGWLLFAVESSLVTRRLKWDTGNELRRMAEIECQGLDPEQATLGMRLLRQDLPILNEARRHVAASNLR